jgi:serine/threonine protein kinase
VYKGKKKDCNEEYAIKVIELKKYSSSNMEMLNNEIDILQSLHHPNIIRCYDIFKTPTKCYIVMEYCPHGDLLTYLTKNGKLHESKAVEIVQQITEGCKYLLSKDIIHRDIKPANIIKGRTQWKIADFGFAIKSST